MAEPVTTGITDVEWLDAQVVSLSKDKDQLQRALRGIINHWDEFGPEHGFDEEIHNARKFVLDWGMQLRYPSDDEVKSAIGPDTPR